MREKAAELVHIACRYLLKERTDDSILLALVVRVIDALVNYGSLEYDEWSSHVQAWKLESAAIIEPQCNFIVPFHAQGKKRYILVLHSSKKNIDSSNTRNKKTVQLKHKHSAAYMDIPIGLIIFFRFYWAYHGKRTVRIAS
ncbi:proteasome activator subunit 4-like [Hordeum vulgare subsp. vulgare]|uniref:proteasome activator subunit 4-like n=1 Tax=Hordeum vulgare subsp. vulgare TaxID=112509 RepID=UPI00162B7E4F|nr:proteasome activator subunit 4-like [Hordeum vulgare subsp. vulgare]